MLQCVSKLSTSAAWENAMSVYAVCPSCKRPLPHDARYCPLCGADLNDPHDARARGATGRLRPQHILRNRYSIMQKLAQGGQSAVYLATDLRANNEPRAIKEMSQANLQPHELERAVVGIQREAEMLTRLKHPAIARVFEQFTDDNKYYLAMEFVPGKTLEDEMIERGQPVRWEEATRWGAALADVLIYLHNLRPAIIYRDLKPSNVMLCPNGALKLIDFGIARWFTQTQSRDTAQLGTDGYAPVEQYASRSVPQSDLYALGASLYHLLTGRVPLSAPLRMADDGLPSIRSLSPAVPESVERVVAKAMSLQVEDRYPDAQSLRDALIALLPPEAGSGPHPIPYVSGQFPALNGSMPGAPRAQGLLGGQRGGAGGTRPRLYVAPLRLDAGALEPEGRITLALEIANYGGGSLSGSAESSVTNMAVEPRNIDDATTDLIVHIETHGLPAGPYNCRISLRTNGGDQIVPVKFVVLGDPRRR
jgi:tRNA A-37 threonylcarbamoyl transferase component Bud32